MDAGCPDSNTIERLMGGALSPDELAKVERHLARCEDCVDVLAAVAQARDDSTTGTLAGERASASPTMRAYPPVTGTAATATLAAGTLLGRYEVRRWLGRGGMGDVYEGFDRHLERRVALKVLRDGGGDRDVARQRLGREAKTLARLSHPNVVTVYDVGLEGEQLFLVMELVEGPTLAAWLKLAPRTWREILDVFLDAGEGLAAAHDVGVIHRDFKPQNVLIGADGKARVSDFGLARSGEGVQEADAASGNGSAGSSSPEPLTESGAVIGTPRYMAPEQTLGHHIDARADQFSFAVALWEALYGNHPFAAGGADVPDRIVHLATEHPQRRGSGPMALAPILSRGLAFDRDRRFGSLHELLVSLRRARRAGRQRAAFAVITAALAVAGALVWSTHRRNTVEVIFPTGEPADWSHLKVIAEGTGTVQCIEALGNHSLRLVRGNPRLVEDIDLRDGRRHPADVLPETYRHGCPSLSPDGMQLLYEGFDANQRPHIFHAANPRGDNAKAVVSCARPSLQSEPQWLSSNDFIFDLDLSHPAVFSLRDNRFTVVPDRDRAGDAGGFRIVAPTGDRIAVMQHRPDPIYATTTTIFRWPELRPEKSITVSFVVAPTFMSFGRDPALLYGRAFRGDEPERQLVAIDARQGAVSLIGKVPGRDVLKAIPVGGTMSALLTRRTIGKVVITNDGAEERVLFSEVGSTYESPSFVRSGKVVALRSRGWNAHIVRLNPADGTSEDLTPGPDDVGVSPLPSGDWLVSRMQPKGIFRCAEDGDRGCTKLTDQASPGMAVSPDGKMLAYWLLDEQGLSLRVLPLDGGPERELERHITQCRPVWSSPTTIWYSQPDGAGFVWREIDVSKGRPTGRSRPGKANCYDFTDDPASPDESGLHAIYDEEFDVRLVTLP